MAQHNARFITVEGGEGVGKSTNMQRVRELLEARGIELCVTREPGGTELGERLRELLLATEGDGPCDTAELLMIFAARAQHLSTVIEPALAQGRWVLCDRYTDATYAYQGFGRGLDIQHIETLETLVQGHRRPDLSILLDVDPSVGLQRAAERGSLDRFEQQEAAFFERVRTGYLERVHNEPERWLVIDAGQSLESVSKALSDGLNAWLDQCL